MLSTGEITPSLFQSAYLMRTFKMESAPHFILESGLRLCKGNKWSPLKLNLSLCCAALQQSGCLRVDCFCCLFY